jgi:hypothetical protein
MHRASRRVGDEQRHSASGRHSPERVALLPRPREREYQ